MNILHIVFFILLCFGASKTQGQDFLMEQSTNKNNTIGDLQAQFDQWADQRDLSQERGWKWYARWLEEQIQNGTSQGTWPDQSGLYQASRDIAEVKKYEPSRRNETWMPVGPRTFPSVPGGRLFHGMGRINTVEFHPTNPDILWVGVAQGGVWKSTNAGQSWLPLTDNLPILRISDIEVDPNNTDIIYISVGDYAYLGAGLDTDARKRNTHYGLGVYKTTDGGNTWNATGLTFNQEQRDASLTRRVFVSPSNSNRLIAAGIQGVFVSNDAGDTWIKKLDEVMADIQRDPVNENTFYASSHRVAKIGIGRPAIWKSTDGGENWLELNSGIVSSQASRIELAVAPSNTNIVYAIVCSASGGLNGFYKSEDAGVTWNLKITEPNILHWYAGTSNGGQGTYDLAIMVDPQDAERVYTGGVNMWGTEDGGDTWKRASFWLPDYGPSLHADHHQYRYNPVDQYFYACHDGGINRSRQIDLFTQAEIDDFGFEFTTQWEDISAGMEISSFYRMDVSRIHEGDVIAGAQDNSTFIKIDTQWVNVVLGDGMDCLFHPTNGDIVYASSQGGRFVRSDNRGINFSSSLTFGISETGAWTTPFEQDPISPNTIYGAFGNIWKSTDLGENWIRLTDFPSIPNSDFILPVSTMSIAPSDRDRFYVAKRIYPTVGVNGEMWTSADGGMTIENITEGLPDSIFITASAVSDMDPNKVWVTFAGFIEGLKVFRSDDAGQTWNNISKGLPNVPVNAIEFARGSLDNTVYIGTDVGIYVFNDILDDWEYFSYGMPNVIVTDLVIDETNELLYASTFGRGIWKSDLAIISAVHQSVKSDVTAQISPNPNSGEFVLSLDEWQGSEMSIEIVDVNGRMVFSERVINFKPQLQKSYSLNLSSGLYFMKLAGQDQKQVIRFIVE
jgi:photosystem II stability/assembly factor-like uncharacterized protein